MLDQLTGLSVLLLDLELLLPEWYLKVTGDLSGLRLWQPVFSGIAEFTSRLR